jgi:hypothetical protein
MEGFAMGATTKFITGLFANVCGRNTSDRHVRNQIVAGQGTRSAAAQGYPSVAHSSRHFSWHLQEQAIDQARWLLERLGGQLKPAFSTVMKKLSGSLSPAWCPAHPRPQAVGRLPQGARRFEG